MRVRSSPETLLVGGEEFRQNQGTQKRQSQKRSQKTLPLPFEGSPEMAARFGVGEKSDSLGCADVIGVADFLALIDLPAGFPPLTSQKLRYVA